MSVIKNMVARVGADFSELYGEFKEANRRSRKEFAEIAKSAGSANIGKAVKDSVSGASKALENVRADITHTENYLNALNDRLYEVLHDPKQGEKSPAFNTLNAEIDKSMKKLDQLEGKKLLLEVQADTEESENNLENVEQKAETAEKAVHGFWANFKEFFVLAREESLKTAEQTEESLENVKQKTDDVAKSSGGLWQSIKSHLSSMGSHFHSSKSGADGLWKSLKRIGGIAVGLKLVSAITGRLRSIIRSYISENAVLQAQTEALKSGLGQSLAPAINLVTNALSAALPYILAVSNAIGSLISMLFGKGWTTIADGANKAAAATGGAASAQEEYNRQLAGFDEITRLDDQKSGGGGGGGNGGISTEITAAKVGWLEDITGSIQNAVDTGDWTGIGKTIGEKVGDALTSAKNWIKDADFAGTAHKVVDGLNGFISAQLKSDTSLGDVVAEFINKGLDVIEVAITDFDWVGLKELVKRNVLDLFSGIDTDKLLLVTKQVSLGVLKVIRDYLFSPVEKFFGGDGKIPWLDSFIDKLEGEISDLEIAIKAKTEPVNNSAEVLQKVKGFMKGPFSEPVASLSMYVRDDGPAWLETTKRIWSKVSGNGQKSSGEIFLELRNSASYWFDSAVSGWSSETQNGKKPVGNVTLGLNNSAAQMYSETQSFLDSYVGSRPSISVGVSLQKSGWSSLNDFIGTINKTIKVNASWANAKSIPEQWLSSTLFNGMGIPSLKFAAQGGIVNAATLFGNTVVGEAGTEAIVPLKRNTEWLDMVADRLSQSGGSSRPIEVVVQIDGTTVGRKVVNYINGQAVSTGVNPLSAYI